VLFTPADEADLSYFLMHLPGAITVTVIGLGSNLIVRDGGVPGVVIRLGGKGFADIGIEPLSQLRAGTAVPDVSWRGRRPMPASTGSPSFAAFPARSAAPCA